MPTTAKEPLQTTDLKDKAAGTKSREHSAHTGDIPGVAKFGEQETLHGRALQGLFFIEPLPSKTVDGADIPNTEKQEWSPRQYEKAETFFPNERTAQVHSQVSK